MIDSLNISGYRGLSKLSMPDIGKINLIVGNNNSGKTSILEAIYILASAGDLSALWKIMSRRGEQLNIDFIPGKPILQDLDVCHLFYMHNISVGKGFSISSTGKFPRNVNFDIVEAKRNDAPALYAQISIESEFSPVGERFAIKISGDPTPLTSLVPLSSRGGLRQDVFQMLNNIASNSPRMENSSPQYISTDSLSVPELISSFNGISLTPYEDLVLQALRFIEPDLERIGIATNGPIIQAGGQFRGGFKAKIKKLDQPIPIGSMGDGIWRMLSLAISLSKSKDNVLIIDEIDAGLHYTVMRDMWKFIIETANSLNVQVFATTHSYDCIKSLAAVCVKEAVEDGDVTIQRVELGNNKTVSYSKEEIIMAAQNSIEVR